MIPYKNLNGDSGVTAYEISADSITVQFNDDWCYRYNTTKTGASHIAKMQRLAEAGAGLAKFISSSGVREQYVEKYKA